MKVLPAFVAEKVGIAAAATIVVFLTQGTAVAQSCHRRYAVQDRTNLSVVEFSYEQEGQWSPNLLAFVLSPGAKQGIDIDGQGSSQFNAKLSNGRVVRSQVDDLCTCNEITIYFSEGVFRMSVR
jgi:hypothetical protein